jgi:asparagine synthase (glutamine-hydrolysing)
MTGWVDFSRDLTLERAVIEAMTETMACRGPDAAGTWIQREAALGHRRLAVIDLVGGAQPMVVSTPSGDVAMVYTGEVYNFTELRRELVALGHSFETSSDTEVVLRGYLQWGESLADRLNGMYAFAIWDSRERKLVMIRDRMGVKPFYFYPIPDGVLFGSEPKAIFANPMAPRAIDLNGLRELIGPVRTSGTAVWKGMREVQPGTIVTVDERGIRERTYWRLESRGLLDDIVRRQLVADVPECVLLSGGLDSSAITALSARELSTRARSFAVDFTGQDQNFIPSDTYPTRDAPYAHEVAEHVGTDHTDIVLDHRQVSDPGVRRKVIAALELPVGGLEQAASMYLLFKAIRQQSTVALSGEAADEIFGGYRQFHDPQIQRADAFPWVAIGASWSDPTGHILTPELRAALDLETYVQDRYVDAVAEVERLAAEDDFTHRMRVMSYLHLTRHVGVLLDRKDRLSMASGLEVRVPFCDHRLVEYVYNTPWSMKSYDGREKSLLRGAVADVLPESVVQRVKSPYPSTSDPKYSAAILDQARELLVIGSDTLFSVVDRNVLEELTRLDEGSLPPLNRSRLERILGLSVWLDLYQPRLIL